MATLARLLPQAGHALSRQARPAWVQWLLAAVAGGSQALALAWPWGVADADWLSSHQGWAVLWRPEAGQPWPLLQVLAMALLVCLVRAAPSIRAAGLLAWLFATAWLSATFWWLFVSMHTYGGLSAPLAAAAVVALAAALALYYSLVLMLFKALSLNGYGFVAIFLNALLWAACWTLAELARGALFTGFPWGSVGYAHVDSLSWLAPWVGVYGMGAVAAGAAAVVAGGVGLAGRGQWCSMGAGRRAPLRRWVRVAAGALVLAVPLALALGPQWRASLPELTRPHGDLPLLLLQGNISQDRKFESESGVPEALDWYGRHLGGAVPVPSGGLVVAPETALPMLPQQLGGQFWQPLLQEVADQGHAVLLGLPLGNPHEGYANGAWAITPRQAWLAQARLGQGESPQQLDKPDLEAQGSPVYRYDKHHLVPFGEFVPPLFRWFVDLMAIPLGDFNRGKLGQAPFEWGGQRIAPNICYEDLFGEELARGFVHAGSAPTVLVNLSNLAWFGNTVALDQHLHISRLRALELGRPMVRATNTGATVVIDHTGRVTHAQPRMTRGTLAATVQGRSGLTPYAHWAARWGHGPVFWSAVLLLLWGAVWPRRPLK